MDTKLLLLPLLALSLVSVWQAGVVAYEYFLRWHRYRTARAFARSKGKPLLVVGRPGGRLRVYGCGDVTLDTSPKVVSDCPQGGVVGDVRHIPFPDHHFGAVFCSHVLDVLDSPEDATQALNELGRVAERVFICYTLRSNLYWRFLAKEIKVWLNERGGTFYIRRRPW